MAVTASTLLVVGATALDFGGGATVETLVGQSPVVVGEAPQKAIVWTLTPFAELELKSRTSRLTLSYAPRLFWRYPNALNLNRPLLLNSVDLTHELEITRRLRWTASVVGSVGEVDYTALSLVFSTPESSPVATNVLKIRSLTADAGLTYQATHRSRLLLTASESYSSALDSSQDALLPEQSQTALQPGYQYQLSHFDTLLIQARLAYQSFSNTQDYVLLAPEVDLTHAFNRRTDATVGIGASHVRGTEAGPSGEKTTETSPSARIGVRSWLYQASELRVRGTTTAGIEWYFDPVQALSYPRATATIGAHADMPPRWTAGLDASFATSARSKPLPNNALETVITLDLPVNYLVSDATTLGFGARGSTRGPHLSRGAPTHQLEMWGYVSLRVVIPPR